MDATTDDNGWQDLFLDAARDGGVGSELTSSTCLKPVFSPASEAAEVAYLEKMLARDRDIDQSGGDY